MIPAQNVQDLMLKEEVLEAVRQDLFHVYSIEKVEDGIELLTGKPAGQQLEDGHWEEGTVFGKVQETLNRYASYSSKQTMFFNEMEKRKDRRE